MVCEGGVCLTLPSVVTLHNLRSKLVAGTRVFCGEVHHVGQETFHSVAAEGRKKEGEGVNRRARILNC